MFTSKISINNLSECKVLTVPYTLIMSFFGGFFYVLVNLLNNTSLSKIPQATLLKGILTFGIVIIFLVISLYGWYANRFFSDERNKSMGVFLMLGMSRKQVYKVICLEKFYLFCINFLFSIIFGLCYNSLSFLMIRKLLSIKGLENQYKPVAIIWLLFILITVYLFTYLTEYNLLRKSTINQIFSSKDRTESAPKANLILGVVGFVFLIIGYGLALTTSNVTTSFRTFILASLLVAIGIIGTFSSGIILLIGTMKKNTRIYYNRKRYVLIAGMLHRLKNSAVSLSLICVLSTITLIVISVMGSLYIEKRNMVNMLSPKEITVMAVGSKFESMLKNIANETKVSLSDKESLSISQSVYGDLANNKLDIDKNGGVTSDYQITVATLSSYNKSNNTNYRLNKNEILVYIQNKKLAKESLVVNGHTYTVKKQINQPRFMFSPGRSITPNIFIITDDTQDTQQILKNKPITIKMEGYDVKGTTLDKQNFYKRLNQTDFKKVGADITSRRLVQSLINTLFGGLFFIGIIFSIAFAMLTSATIYYKQLSEGVRDRSDYITMEKLGMTHKMIKAGVRNQINFTFTLPMLFSLFNLLIAMPVLYKIMVSVGFNSVGLFIETVVVCFVAYTLFYWLICHYTSRMYYRLISDI